MMYIYSTPEMDATNALVRLTERLDNLRRSSDPVEAKKLLAWLKAGGLSSLKGGVTTFLTAVSTSPEGSTFYIPPSGPKALPVDVVALAQARYARHKALNADLLESKILDMFSPALAVYETDDMAMYLAGRGVTVEQLNASNDEAGQAQGKLWLAGFEDAQTRVSNSAYEYFLQAFNDERLTTRHVHIGDITVLLEGHTSPFTVVPEVGVAYGFADYLAGAGYTQKMLIASDADVRKRLVVAYMATGSPAGFDAFIAGLGFTV